MNSLKLLRTTTSQLLKTRVSAPILIHRAWSTKASEAVAASMGMKSTTMKNIMNTLT